MESKELKILAPEGYEIDKEKSTFECIKFKPKPKPKTKPILPKTWEEFCKTHGAQKSEYWITHDSKLQQVEGPRVRCLNTDRNLLPSKKLAEAMIVLCQLIQLRDCYNDGWTPNYSDTSESKYVITVSCNDITTICNFSVQRTLVFKTQELCKEFLENFKDLIETAKPLL